MKLLQARIRGFQSFGDSEDIIFTDGINLIIGQNNAGKSALLRALLPSLPDDRHRTPDKWETFKLPYPKIELTLEVSGTEIHDWILRSNNRHEIPTPNNDTKQVQDFIEKIFKAPKIFISIYRDPNGTFYSHYPSHQLFGSSSKRTCAALDPRDGEISITGLHHDGDTIPSLLFDAWQHGMFYFSAERMTIGECTAGYALRLQPNAGNLPNVLHTLSNERGGIFQRLLGHLREIFSTVGNLSIRTRPDNNRFEIRVWPTEVMEQVELSFPLDYSGTGVAQVTAILAAIMTVNNTVIIIDEINSFLHPAAAKALLRILQTHYAQNQYIISTHAPEVIAFSNPKTIHLVSRAGYESSIKRLDLDDVGKFREIAEHLGISMSDVFAAERVIWVEGPTEELCFPYLYQEFFGQIPHGTAITSVVATGDFNSKKRDKTLVYEIYQRLSTATAKLVVSVAFSFDTEKLTHSEKTKMQTDSKGLLHFLPKRHFECYLIDPEAIAAFITERDNWSTATIQPKDVEVALREEAAKPPLQVKEWNGDITDNKWLEQIDAANLIKSVCQTLSDQRVGFNKKDDSLFILKYILKNNRVKLKPLADYVKSLVDAVSR